MLSYDKKINNLFIYWITITLLLIFLMIIIGGLTRLTNSGLSITEWELFKGILPPLNNFTWQLYFDQYKQIPQYKLLNFDMNLSEFKIISSSFDGFPVAAMSLFSQNEFILAYKS